MLFGMMYGMYGMEDYLSAIVEDDIMSDFCAEILTEYRIQFVPSVRILQSIYIAPYSICLQTTTRF